MPSPKDVATYDLKPEMSADGVADGVVQRHRLARAYDFVLVNFANADMVGHTGVLPAAIKAVDSGRRLPRRASRGARAHGTAWSSPPTTATARR